MSKSLKIAFFFSLLIALIVPFAISSAKTKDAVKYTVLKDNEETAKLSVLNDKNFTKITIERKGQTVHTYTKSIANNNITVDIGDKQFLAYNNKSGDFQLQNLENSSYQIKNTKSNVSQLKWTENKLAVNSLAVQNMLSDDMRIFRIVRNFNDKVPTRSFELAYVVLTSDESLYWTKDFDGYNVKSSDGKVKNTISFVKTSFDGDLTCKEGCDSRLAACLQSVLPDQRIECYRIADGCHGRCDGPAPAETPIG